LTFEGLCGKICYEGLDLSSVNDLTAKAYVFPKQPGLGKLTVAFKIYVPAENERARSRKDKVPYDIWINQGYITATPGDVVDYGFIKWDLRKDNEKYAVKSFGGDPWQAEKLRQELELLTDLTAEESKNIKPITLITVPQNIATFTPVMKEIERLIGLNEIQFIYNPVAEWAFGNVMLVTDGNENYKPDKKKSVDRIDPIVAMFDAFFLYMKDGASKESIYNSRGVRTV